MPRLLNGAKLIWDILTDEQKQIYNERVEKQAKQFLLALNKNGIKNGRKMGYVGKKKLDGVKDLVLRMYKNGTPKTRIASHFDVNYMTVCRFIKSHTEGEIDQRYEKT
jgi:hypothetical protein